MATAKYNGLIGHEIGAEFDVIHNPGAQTPLSGIYRCAGCGVTIVCENKRTFPPQNHHQHTAAQGLIRWQLLVKASHTHPSI